jgi:cell division protein FtsI (penicillin-binding protein 3)
VTPRLTSTQQGTRWQAGTRQQAGRTAAPRQRPATDRAGRSAPARRQVPGQRRQQTRSQPPRPPRVARPTRSRRPGDPDRRLRAALLATLFVLSLFAGRLIQLQGLDASKLAETALAQRTKLITLPAHRGDIVDATGAVLATTVERRNIFVDQVLVRCYKVVHCGRPNARGDGDLTGVRAAVHDLSGPLNLTAAELTAKLTGNRHFAYLVKNVSPEVWRTAARLSIPGLDSEQASRRLYPAGQVGASVIGFVGSDGRPLGGLERTMNSTLAGHDGSLRYERSQDGLQITTGLTSEIDPQPGRTVQLTIDRDLQWRAQQALAAKVAETGAPSGYAVVMNPQTGDVLALATVPTFDANDPGAAPAADRGNRALLDVFEPGSTSKVITIAAALEEKLVTPQTRLTVDGQIRRAGRVFHDSHAHGPEPLTVAGVLAQSSNVGTVMTGERLAPAKLYDYLTRFGVGRPSGIGAPESAGILAPAQDWSGSQRYTVMFGQGLSVTAIQTASVFATIANDGVRVTPRLVSAVIDPDGTVHHRPIGSSTRAVSVDTARQMRLMLENVVGDEGTAARAEIPGFRVAGKTGTAQYADPTCHCYRGYTASFIGMAPADHPQLVTAVVLQRPVKGHFGGTVAAPVFQQLMSYALEQRGVTPTGSKAPVVPMTWK